MRVTKGLHMDMPLVTFSDWLRLEDELAKISRETLPFFVDGKKVETAKDLGLEVIGEELVVLLAISGVFSRPGESRSLVVAALHEECLPRLIM